MIMMMMMYSLHHSLLPCIPSKNSGWSLISKTWENLRILDGLEKSHGIDEKLGKTLGIVLEKSIS